jgi:hypothetical protein
MKKRPPTNWRKRAEMFEDLFAKKSEMCCKIFVENKEFQHQIEVGDQLIAAQRERLIRLTEIKNQAQAFLYSWGMGRADDFPTQGFGCQRWIRLFEVYSTRYLAKMLQEQIAKLEVDTACPPKETVRCGN